MDANQWRYDASSRRDAVGGAVERSYVGDRRRHPVTQWGASHYHHNVDGHDPSGSENGRPGQKRPHGSSDLPQPVQFVSAAGSDAASSRDPEHSCYPPCQAMAPPKAGGLAANAVVVNMMKRMNYKEGSGLGKHGQGINAPIELPFRPKNAGVGTVEGSYSRDADGPPPSADNWPKWDSTGGSSERADAVRSQKRDQEGLDEAILARPLETGRSTAAVVARVQNALAQAAAGQGNPCYKETAAIITEVMKWVQEESASGTLTVGELICKFKALKERCPQEYAAFRLADAARAVVAPVLRSAFRQWEPLKDPSRGLNTVNALRHVLLGDDGSAASLVGDVVMEAVRAAEWSARDYEPMFLILETWVGTLPPAATRRVLEEVVVPRLVAAVEEWEPRWEHPCHAWVHPWIPLLELQQVYATVRRKFGTALARWHAARAGADYHMVVPWKDAFGPAVWGKFVEQTVVPYLREGLRELQVAPPDQDGGAFRGVMGWASVVESRDMARLLDEEFFAKWLDALCGWLLAERPEVEEAVAWHQGWKRLLTPELLADERVRVPLEAGLVMISRSAQGLEISRPGLRWDQHAGRAHPCRYRSRRRGGGWQ